MAYLALVNGILSTRKRHSYEAHLLCAGFQANAKWLLQRHTLPKQALHDWPPKQPKAAHTRIANKRFLNSDVQVWPRNVCQIREKVVILRHESSVPVCRRRPFVAREESPGSTGRSTSENGSYWRQ